MAKPLISDELWTLIEPLLPREQPRPKGGRPPIPHRAALSGILFVLKSGLPWEMLPQEMGCGSGMTPACAGAGCAGGGCTLGKPPAFGKGSIACCSTGWAGPMRLTGAVLASTALVFPPKGGPEDRP
jgi:transposase